MSEGERFQLGTIGALTLSVVSSVSIVICNKALISTLGFSFGMLRKLGFFFLFIYFGLDIFVTFLFGYGIYLFLF